MGDTVLLNEIIEGNGVCGRFLFKPYMCLLTGYPCNVSGEHLVSITLKENIFLGLINITNQLVVTE